MRLVLRGSGGFRGFLYARHLYEGLLGGSWVAMSGVISPLRWVITIVTLLITPLIATHEPPSRRTTVANNPGFSFRGWAFVSIYKGSEPAR